MSFAMTHDGRGYRIALGCVGCGARLAIAAHKYVDARAEAAARGWRFDWPERCPECRIGRARGPTDAAVAASGQMDLFNQRRV